MARAKKIVKRFSLRFRMTIISRWQRIWLGISWSMIRGKFLFPTAEEQWHISGSSLLPDKNFRTIRSAQKRWAEAERIQRLGKYHLAHGIRVETLSELYNYQGITDSKYFPPLLGTTWSSNFGHLSAIGHHRLAQKLNIIPAGARVLLDNNKSANPELLGEISQGMLVVKQNSGTRWSDMPNFWHFSERIRTVKSFDGFIDTNQLFNEIFAEKNLKILKDHYFSLSEEYSFKSLRKLESYGLPKLAKFITIHIRERGPVGDPRAQPIASFIPAINEITRNGYWVIRIGDPSMLALPSIPNLIDLVPKQQSASELHAYSLARCEFYLGTASGPSWLPRIYGVPSLLTNLNEIGTQVGNAPEGSIHLPKKYLNRKGEVLTMSQLFTDGFAFSSLLLQELRIRGVSLEPNTSAEILDATKELLQSINKKKRENSPFQDAINSIRNAYRCPTSGNFSESFLSNNPKWLS